MFDHLGIWDSGHIEIVKSAIADGRSGFNVQAIHSVGCVDLVYYRECLATLRGTDGRQYGAGTFIPHLEALGHAALIDQNMVRLVLDQLERDPVAVLGCNVSADNLTDRQTWDGIAGQIRSRPNLASRLILELTESRPLYDLARSLSMLDEVRELGCQIALDDFGTGYASPRLLRLIDFDIVKIDRSFLNPIETTGFNDGSLSHLINFASCYSPAIVMEGIETVEQAQFSAISGATHLQGFGMSLPVPAVMRIGESVQPGSEDACTPWLCNEESFDVAAQQ